VPPQKQKVIRFDIPVHDGMTVKEIQSFGSLLKIMQQFVGWYTCEPFLSAGLQPLPQRPFS
jgi:hypothetical protein